MALPLPPLEPHFLIVGSERSGTTLVQRIATELPGVRVPAETHFFKFYRKKLSNQTFPMDEAALREALTSYLAMPVSQGFVLDTDQVIEDLGGQCRSVLELFDVCVRRLAGPAEIYGEKTPHHLAWWRPLHRARPDLQFIGVVRDPRGVVASALAVPWGSDDPVRLAEGWRHDQRLLKAARDELPPDRILVVRYEDVVVEPEAARVRIAKFLGIDASGATEGSLPPPSELYHPWEHWKDRTTDAITDDRVRAWEQTLSPAQSSIVLGVCHVGMRAFGYGTEAPAPVAAALRVAALPPRQQLDRLRRRRGARSMQRALDTADLGGTSMREMS